MEPNRDIQDLREPLFLEEAVSCAGTDHQSKLERGEPCMAPLSRSCPRISSDRERGLSNRAAPGSNPGGGTSRRALPVWCTGLASKAMETAGPVLGSIPRLSAHDPISGNFNGG